MAAEGEQVQIIDKRKIVAAALEYPGRNLNQTARALGVQAGALRTGSPLWQ